MTIHLNVIGIIVADMDKSLDFYRRLGLDVPADTDNNGHVQVELPGGMKLMFDTIDVIRSFDPGWTRPSGGHAIGLAFDCGDVATLEATYASLLDAGYRGHREPWDAFWGQRYAQVLDPDGNVIDLYVTLPKS
jgi:catechol 2,3-dioxygenase-like lactoylglutathione lyase family enzyme